MKKFKQYAFPYLELDSSINIDNFETDGKALSIDEDFIIEIFGTEDVLKPNKHILNYYNRVTDPSKEFTYISNFWINKSLYYQLESIIHQYQVNISCDTISVAILIIDYYFNQFKNKLNDSSQTKELVEENRSLLEIIKFVELIYELTSSPIKNSSIDIYVQNQRRATFNAGIILPELRKWHYGYYGQNIHLIKQWLKEDANYFFIKTKIEQNALTKKEHTSQVSDFKSWIVQALFNGFNKYFTDKSQAEFIYFIGDILAVKNIFNLQTMKKKGRYDTIFRCLNS